MNHRVVRVWYLMVSLLVGCGGDRVTHPTEGVGNTRDSQSRTADAPTDGLRETPVVGDTDAALRDDPDPADPFAPPDQLVVKDATRRLVAQLVSDNQNVRRLAAEGLQEHVSDPLPYLLELLNDDEAVVRRGAAFGLLDRFDPADESVVEALVERLSDTDPTVRSLALQGVSQFDGDSIDRALPWLRKLLADPAQDLGLRIRVSRLLGRHGKQAATALPELLDVMGGSQPRALRTAVIDAATKVAEDPDDVIAALRQLATGDEDSRLRRVAVLRLGRFGGDAADAAEDLAAALVDPDTRVRQSAATSLGQIGPSALPALQSALDSDVRELQVLALVAIGRMGSAAREAESRVRPLRDHQDSTVRRAAEVVLFRIGASQEKEEKKEQEDE